MTLSGTCPICSFRRLLACTVVFFSLASAIFAQEGPVKPGRTSSPTVSVVATSAADLVRFTAPGEGVQLRLEVYSDTGQQVSDSGFADGNVMNWNWRGAQTQSGFQDVDFLCLVTVKTLSGRLYQRHGMLSVRGGQASLHVVDYDRLKAALALDRSHLTPAVEVSGNDAGTPLTLLPEGASPSVMIIAHDGSDGQVTSTEGALTFRTGDVFAGKEKEKMRITPDGRIGIGTDKPQATLDVAGDIQATGTVRANRIQFADGTVQSSGSSFRKDKEGNLAPNVAGTGTQNYIPKWTDNAGTLGDSLLVESGGGIELRPAVAGVGVNPTLTNLSTVAGFAQLRFYPVAGPNTNMSFSVVPRGVGITNNRAQFSVFNTDVNADGTNYEFASLRARGSDFVFGTGKAGTGVNRPFMLASGFLSDNTTNNGQLYLGSNGNVGINTTNPASRFDVVGDINTSTQYNIGGNRIFSIAGTGNTFAGASAGNANTGQDNSFFGTSAGAANTSGGSNSFFGRSAGAANTTGLNNSFFGKSAGAANTTGTSNSFFGLFAGGLNTTGASNSFFGAVAGAENTIGENNSFFGNAAGTANTTGSANSFFGGNAGDSNTTGNSNSFFGHNAGTSNTLGTSNSFFGGGAGQLNTTSSGNSFFGYLAGSTNMTGSANSFFGASAGIANSSGGANSFFGNRAGDANTTGASNSFFGNDAGGANTTGPNNSFFGNEAGVRNTTGNDNSFFGAVAGFNNTTGAGNSFFGRNAGANNTTGPNNSFFGIQAGEATTTGSSNSFFGSFAGQFSTTGNDNSFFGLNAGRNTEGGTNSFFGGNAGQFNTEGASNTFVGYNSGQSNTTEADNTFVGANANGAAGITNATAIGANASVTQSDSIILGSSAKVGIGTTAPKKKLHVAAGDLLLSGTGQGVILTSPNGLTCASLTISNAGALVTTVIACP
ncbi:MAG: hypothetical protein ABI596_14265 [Pyrinomonadaceae bacterium]